MLTSEAIAITGAFKIKNDSELTFYFDFSDPPSATPGTVYTSFDVVTFTDCTEAATCENVGGYIVRFTGTYEQCCAPYIRPGTFESLNGYIDPADYVEIDFVVLGNPGLSYTGAYYNALTINVFERTPVDDCVTTPATPPIQMAYLSITVAGVLGGFMSIFGIDLDAPVATVGFNTIHNGTTAAPDSGLAPFTTTDTTADCALGYWATGASGGASTASARPICTVIATADNEEDIDNTAQTVSFPFTATNGSGDWYCTYFYNSLAVFGANPYIDLITPTGLPWITITSALSGNGNATLTLDVEANASGSPRTATIIINNQLFIVNQAD